MKNTADDLDILYLAGRLNFVVDNDLIVKSISNESMNLAVPKDSMLGAHIMAHLPLTKQDNQKIENTFAAARQSGETQTVQYWLESRTRQSKTESGRANEPNFEAEVTPVGDTQGLSGFFIRVRQIGPLA